MLKKSPTFMYSRLHLSTHRLSTQSGYVHTSAGRSPIFATMLVKCTTVRWLHRFATDTAELL